jgi:hypothetical protein
MRLKTITTAQYTDMAVYFKRFECTTYYSTRLFPKQMSPNIPFNTTYELLAPEIVADCVLPFSSDRPLVEICMLVLSRFFEKWIF